MNFLKQLQLKMNAFFNLKIIVKIITLFCIAILCVHFSILGIYQLPKNPIQHQFKYELNDYVNPFFTQTWTLFAPNPINFNMSLLMRFEYEDNGETKLTEWVDLTEPILKLRKDNFLAPLLRINKFTESCMSSINNDHIAIMNHIAETDSIKTDSVKSKELYYKTIASSYGYKSIIQYSKYVAKNYLKTNSIEGKNVKMQFKIFNAIFPRFSKRKEDYYDLNNYKFNEIIFDFVKI